MKLFPTKYFITFHKDKIFKLLFSYTECFSLLYLGYKYKTDHCYPSFTE